MKQMKNFYIFLVALALSCFTVKVSAQAGTLDSSFNGKGYKLSLDDNNNNNGYYNGYGKGIAVQPDGKIISVGYENSYYTNNNFTIFRLNPDGSADNTFGNGGRVSVNASQYYNNWSEARAVAVQADGKIVVAGIATGSNGYQAFATVRLNSNGSLDNTFGNNGIVSTQFTNNGYYNYSYAESVTIDAAGKILVGGGAIEYYNNNNYYYYYYYNYNYAAVRLNTDGSVDNSFANNGKFMFNFNNNYNNYYYYNYNWCYQITVAPDNSIVLGGTATNNYDYYYGNSYGYGVVKLTSNGQLDHSFNGSGYKVVRDPSLDNYYNNNYSEGRTVQVQLDNKILIGGFTYSPNTYSNNIYSYYRFGVARLLPDGSFDQSFGDDGYVTAAALALPEGLDENYYSGENYNYGYSMVIQDNGKIVMGGRSQTYLYNYNGGYNNYEKPSFVRFNENGAIDSTFGTNGASVVNISEYNNGNYPAGMERIAKQPDGKIVGVGYGHNNNGQQQLATLRIFANNDCPQTKVVGLPSGNCEGIVVNNIASHFELYNGEQVISVAYTVSGATEAAGNGDVSGTFFNKGISTVTYTAQIQTTENTTFSRSCSFTVNVKDVTAPVINCPAAITVGMNYYDWAVWGDNLQLAQPTGSDDCGTVTFTNDAAGRWFQEGENTVIWTATDAAGNTTTCTQTVNVSRDNVAPEITCPENILINTTSGCGAHINFAASATDNSGNANISYSIQPGSYFGVGTTTVIVTATDNNNNSSQCSFTVTVKDATAPSLSAPADMTVSAGAACSKALALGNASAHDDCGSVTITNDAPEAFAVGTTTVTWTATDAAGNITTAVQKVTVVDDVAPIVKTKSATLALVNGSVTVTSSDIDNGSSDGCGIVSLTVSPNVFTCSQIGEHTVTLTAKDAKGNTSSATAVVTVTGNIPVVSTQVIKSNNTFTGLNANTIALGYGAQSVTLKATDATPGNTTTYAWTAAAGLTNTNSANAVFTPTSAGTYVFTVTATSGSGCTSTATVTVIVTDVRCGNKNEKVIVCHIPPGKPSNPQTICIAPEAVAAHLAKGSTLGTCGVPTTARGSETVTSSSAVVTKEELIANDGTFIITATPNPTTGLFTARLNNAAKGKARVEVIGLNGNVVEVKNAEVSSSVTQITFDLSGKAQGMYKLRAITSDGKQTVTTVLIQR
jgi:uncharacterized delta-60 repeat protein